MSSVKVLIADDQTLMRDGLKTVLELEEDIEVIGTAANGREAVIMAESLKPDVVLMDIRMPEMDGVEAVKIIKSKASDIKVIMLTTFNDDEYIMQAIANGAIGYLLKDIEMEKLSEAIRDAANNKMIMPPEVAAKLSEGLNKINLHKVDNSNKVHEKLSELSEREMEVAAMMVQGFTNKQIASALYISEGTTRNYISNIYSKIGIGDRTKAVLYLRDLGVK